MIPMEQVVEVRATWTRVAKSPWAGYEMRYAAGLVDGQTVALDGNGAVALLEELRAAGVRLVESVEGWSRVVRVAARTPRPASVEEAVAQMVARGKEGRPALGGRVEAAGELVMAGRVVFEGETGRVGPYVIAGESCTCADFVHRGGWCKHRLAVRMARHLVRCGFELPEAVERPATPQVSEANRRLIASGAVVEGERRSLAAYLASAEAAQRRALGQLSRGAGTIAADLARRAGNVGQGVEP